MRVAWISYLRSGLGGGGPFLFGGALVLRIVRVVHLEIVIVRMVLDLLHAAFARNVCRYCDTGRGDTPKPHTCEKLRRRTTCTRSQTIWRSVREEGRNALYYRELADGVAPRLRKWTPDGATVAHNRASRHLVPTKRGKTERSYPKRGRSPQLSVFARDYIWRN